MPIKNRLFRFALRMVGQSAEAEDVVQEVFIKLWNNRQHMDAVTNIEAWCITATRNLSIDKLRSKHQRLQPMRAGFDLLDHSATPYEAAAGQDVFEQVRRLMNQLPPMHRDIMQPPKGMVVDHIDHNTLNNRWCNLRLVTPEQNYANAGPRGGPTEYV
ncbi:MAG: sigma-70 family RNA polymerase sigma factor, partial [Bacteroidetes bacterium]|nr:sigma-70 family RNA polymerase sigma factor [Bacteroidota bacterium]